MKRINYFINIIFLCLLISCKTSQKQTKIDKLNRYTIVAYNPNEKYPLFENAKPTNLTYEEILELEKIIKPKISKNLKEHKYFRQYVAAINSAGEKLVWINFFCENYYDASHETFIMEASDGGNCFFQLKVNLNQKNCYFYMENMDG